MKRFLGILILLLGQAFIVAAMLLLPHGLEQNIMILDTVVLSIIWWVFSFDLIRPIISEGDHAPEVGSLGIRWQGQLLYAFLAIVFGILAAYYSLKFEYQLLGQGGLFGILVLTWLFSLMAKKKVSEVASAETKAGSVALYHALLQSRGSGLRAEVHPVGARDSYRTSSRQDRGREFARERIAPATHARAAQIYIELILTNLYHGYNR